MANYKQVGYGSKGDDVKTLQKMLNNNGYNLAVDGSFGSKTLAAVKDYQKKNKLSVDGIVGNNTWGALTKTSAGGTATGSSTGAGSFNYGNYKPGSSVTNAESILNQHNAQKPGEYKSQWQAQLDDTINKILNREPFSYDVNGDALYQQYKDQYVTQGQMAMMDTMGQAQAMTGGYGNSYAQSVGQQTYHGYLQQLNDRVPELYQLALDKYNQEGQDLYNQYAMLGDQENQDYGRYRDAVGDWQTDRDYYTGRYDSERTYDYNKWADGRDFAYDQYIDDRNYNYQVGRDKIEDEWRQKEFDEAVRQFDAQNQKTTTSPTNPTVDFAPTTNSNTPGSLGAFNNAVNNRGVSSTDMKAMQSALGVTADGNWGPITKAAAMEMWGVDTPEAAYAMYQKLAPAYEFNGSTYNHGVDLLSAHGLSRIGANLMPESEWNRKKSSYRETGEGGAEVTQYETYQDYLKAFILYAFENKQ